jgi:carbonic anhydrase/acetyltransferase-like protein (isoleucine patch superfamily)
MGMQIGEDVYLPASTWIDISHCYLIRIGDHCGFGEGCLLLAHDAQMDEFLDAARIGRIVIHPSSHIGAGTIILPGVEIGPRTIVGGGSVVTRSLPPDTVCAGNPARVLCSLEEYLEKHRKRAASQPTFDYMEYVRFLTPERRAELLAAAADGDAYITGGRSAELRGEGGTPRTESRGRSSALPGRARGVGVFVLGLAFLTLFVCTNKRNSNPFFVEAGGDLQAALDAALPGDVILLQAGATYTGPFTLPKKDGGAWITIRTGAPDSELPPDGTRITPAYADQLPKLVAASGAVITAAPGARHYRFIGVEIAPRPGTFLFNLVLLGSGNESNIDHLPYGFVFDRCYLHGDPVQGTRRGIAMNARNVTVMNSYLSDFKEAGADSQAVGGWNGPGPFKIVNNYLEAAGENVMFGGADPKIPDLVPSDIEIRRNHFDKPLSWKTDDPTYAGTPWTVKNLFELKNARRVLIEGNLFEHNWVHAQAGFAILFTVRNQEGTAPWSVVEEVTFSNNIVRHAGSGINILGRDDNYPSRQTRGITILNNLFEDVGDTRWGGGGRLFQLLDGTADIVIDHNTAFQTGNAITAGGAPHTGFVFRNNIVPHNQYGVVGDGTAPGHSTLSVYFPGAEFVKNVLVGGLPTNYPPDNFFPLSLLEVGFLDLAGGDYRLGPLSPYRNAGTDGKDIGADMDALTPALQGVAKE